MDTEDPRRFVEVADAGGVSAGARRLGVQLLGPTTRGPALTEAGVEFRDYVARVSAEIDAAREVIQPTCDLTGRLRVAIPLIFGPTNLAPVPAELARRHPRLQIRSSYSDRFVDHVTEGDDCAIQVGYLQDSSRLARRVRAIHGKLLASPDFIKAHGRPEETVLHHAPMPGTEARQFVDGDKFSTINPQGLYKADNSTALAAAAGLGVDRLRSRHRSLCGLGRTGSDHATLPATLGKRRHRPAPGSAI